MSAKCIACGGDMDASLKEAYHPSCMLNDDQVSEKFTRLGDELKRDLTNIIAWADNNSPRSLQVTPGPSEMGDACDRRLAYRLAAIEEINHRTDPWAAIVGTAIHGWLERAVQRYCEANKSTNWMTERAVQIDDLVTGHSDLYRKNRRMVIDYKTKSAEKMALIRQAGAAAVPGDIVQTHLYGMGYENAGLPVELVSLVCLPRAGRLKDMYVIVEPYDRRIAQYALDRLYAIAEHLVELDVFADPLRWNAIPATPSDSCGLCPWYDPNRLTEHADDKGCPGR